MSTVKPLVPLTVAAVAMLLSGCALLRSEPDGVVPPDAKVLSASELDRVMNEAVSKRRLFRDDGEYGMTYVFDADGTFSILLHAQGVDGRWRIDRETGALCTRVGKKAEDCSQVYRMSTNPERFYIDVKGNSQQENTFTSR